jgi:hypothetical protein
MRMASVDELAGEWTENEIAEYKETDNDVLRNLYYAAGLILSKVAQRTRFLAEDILELKPADIDEVVRIARQDDRVAALRRLEGMVIGAVRNRSLDASALYEGLERYRLRVQEERPRR